MTGQAREEEEEEGHSCLYFSVHSDFRSSHFHPHIILMSSSSCVRAASCVDIICDRATILIFTYY